MPRRTDLNTILVFGSGPIIIGQACEFDYSGTQAVRALKEEGYRVVLLNSNPATIMTDPEFADATYIEPLTVEYAEKVIARERPQAILPTIGGQTALNLAVRLHERGILEKYGVELIGANVEAIRKAEGREQFRDAMNRIGMAMPNSGIATTIDQAMALAEEIGFPAIIRPAFTLGGTGGGIAYNLEEYREICAGGLAASPTSEILIDQSVLGWKEFELEVMRDLKDQVVIICSIENLDPMGVHTGDSITVAPAQTLTDREYQRLRDASIAIIREIGVDTGGSNIQFGINPENGEFVVIEMNPRVSRSSALASKATGFPIAKIAAKLAVGYTLDELANDITKSTPASFEPAIDYVVTKIPRFTFEKFPQAQDVLTTAMKSVGEVMAIGRTMTESLQKALRSLEIGTFGFDSPRGWDLGAPAELSSSERSALQASVRTPSSRRIWHLADAMRAGIDQDELFQWTKIDPWFLRHIRDVIEFEAVWAGFRAAHAEELAAGAPAAVDRLHELLTDAKAMGFADARLARLWGIAEVDVERMRREQKILPVWKRVDTCAGEFEAQTPYLYSSYEDVPEVERLPGRKVAILGGGPNRIGQGIEFDYCCVHACFALREAGTQAIMINCNPETVSTDYDISDRLYFEPLTKEDVLSILEMEGVDGVILQFGGQTPLKLAGALEARGIPILGTSPDAIDVAEDRDRFQKLVDRLGLLQPANGLARSVDEAVRVAADVGYPVVVRPSYVLGGRAMQIVYDEEMLRRYMVEAVQVSPEHPILIDGFLERAVEFDLDAICDGEDVWVGGLMQHIEAAGIHSGDSSCSLPPNDVPDEILDTMIDQARRLALELGVVGLMNIQFAVRGRDVFLLEVNPRASRTVPFVSKATGIPLAKIATRVMLGEKLKDFNLPDIRTLPYVAVKESVFPFNRFPGVDTLLGPEMKSTGEVMGIDHSFAVAFAKASIGAGTILPREGTVFVSVDDCDKPYILEPARKLGQMGFRLIATGGTAAYLREKGVEVETVLKVAEGRPNIVDVIKSKGVALVLNTPSGPSANRDSLGIRRATLEYNVPYFTTTEAARVAVDAIEALRSEQVGVRPIQEWFAGFLNKP